MGKSSTILCALMAVSAALLCLGVLLVTVVAVSCGFPPARSENVNGLRADGVRLGAPVSAATPEVVGVAVGEPAAGCCGC